jgi:regulatory LuxR family protein
VSAVAAGHLYLSPPFSDNAIESYRKRAEEAAIDPYTILSEREREVLHLAAEGLGNTELAARLGISRGRWRPTAPTSCASWAYSARWTSCAMPCDAGSSPRTTSHRRAPDPAQGRARRKSGLTGP